MSITSYPLANPSVESKAIVLTIESPKCYATSKTNFWSFLLISKEFKIAGNFLSNYTSTTAPII